MDKNKLIYKIVNIIYLIVIGLIICNVIYFFWMYFVEEINFRIYLKLMSDNNLLYYLKWMVIILIASNVILGYWTNRKIIDNIKKYGIKIALFSIPKIESINNSTYTLDSKQIDNGINSNIIDKDKIALLTAFSRNPGAFNLKSDDISTITENITNFTVQNQLNKSDEIDQSNQNVISEPELKLSSILVHSINIAGLLFIIVLHIFTIFNFIEFKTWDISESNQKKQYTNQEKMGFLTFIQDSSLKHEFLGFNATDASDNKTMNKGTSLRYIELKLKYMDILNEKDIQKKSNKQDIKK